MQLFSFKRSMIPFVRITDAGAALKRQYRTSRPSLARSRTTVATIKSRESSRTKVRSFLILVMVISSAFVADVLVLVSTSLEQRLDFLVAFPLPLGLDNL